MQDQEFVLRFVAVCFYGVANYDSSTEEFLNEAMGYLNRVDKETEYQIKERFCQVMIDAYQILDRYAFRKMAWDGMRRPVNKALYEAWCNNLFFMERDEIEGLIRKKSIVQEKFIELCEWDDFIAALRNSDKKSVLYRLDCIYDLTREVLYD